MPLENPKLIAMEDNEQRRLLAKKLLDIIKKFQSKDIGYQLYASSMGTLGRSFNKEQKSHTRYVLRFRFIDDEKIEEIKKILSESGIKLVELKRIENKKEQTTRLYFLISVEHLNE